MYSDADTDNFGIVFGIVVYTLFILLLGFIVGIMIGISDTENNINEQICKQLYLDTKDYLLYNNINYLDSNLKKIKSIDK